MSTLKLDYQERGLTIIRHGKLKQNMRNAQYTVKDTISNPLATYESVAQLLVVLRFLDGPVLLNKFRGSERLLQHSGRRC